MFHPAVNRSATAPAALGGEITRAHSNINKYAFQHFGTKLT